MIKTINELIKKHFQINYSSDDFLEGYRQAKNLSSLSAEDIEDFKNQMTPELLEDFAEVIIQEINDRLVYLFN